MIKFISSLCFLVSALSAQASPILNVTSTGSQKIDSGVGFLIQTSREIYLISPNHVLGGSDPSVPSLSLKRLIYKSSDSDLIVYIVNRDKVVAEDILFRTQPQCRPEVSIRCLDFNKSSVENSSVLGFRLAWKEGALLPAETKNFVAENYQDNTPIAENDSRSLSVEDGKVTLSGLRVYEAQGTGGFSGAPVIKDSGLFRGMFLRYDPMVTRSFALPAEAILKVIENFESSGRVIVEETKPSVKMPMVVAGRGGDTADGSRASRPLTDDLILGDSASNMALGPRPVAYFEYEGLPLFPNRTAEKLIQNGARNETNRVVYRDDPNLSYAKLLSMHFKGSSAIAFEFPAIASSQNQIIRESSLKIEDGKILIKIPVAKPVECNLEIEFDKRGILMGSSEFNWGQSIMACGNQVLLDFRDLFTVNLDYLTESDFKRVQVRWHPIIKIKPQSNGPWYTLEFRNYSH